MLGARGAGEGEPWLDLDGRVLDPLPELSDEDLAPPLEEDAEELHPKEINSSLQPGPRGTQ